MVWRLLEPARRAAVAGDRRGAVRRPGHRHRQVHVREHRPARAPDGGRAARGRRGRRRRSTATCTRTSRRPSSSCSRAALANMQRFDDGALTLSHLSKADYEATGAEEGYSEGVVDHLRALEGTDVAGARARPALRRQATACARSRCARPTTASTSRASPASQGGGGHRRAAGFTTAIDDGRAGRVPAARGRRAARRARAG